MQNQKNTIFVGNLSFRMEKSDLQNLFEKFGEITEIHIPLNKDTQQPRGFAFITFTSEESANDALTMDNQESEGRKIRVNIANGKKEGGAPRSSFGGRPSSGGSRGGFGGSRGGFGGSERGGDRGGDRDRRSRY